MKIYAFLNFEGFKKLFFKLVKPHKVFVIYNVQTPEEKPIPVAVRSEA